MARPKPSCNATIFHAYLGHAPYVFVLRRYTKVAYPASYPLALMCDFSAILLYSLTSVFQIQSVNAIMQFHRYYYSTHHEKLSVVAPT